MSSALKPEFQTAIKKALSKKEIKVLESKINFYFVLFCLISAFTLLSSGHRMTSTGLKWHDTCLALILSCP